MAGKGLMSPHLDLFRHPSLGSPFAIKSPLLPLDLHVEGDYPSLLNHRRAP